MDSRSQRKLLGLVLTLVIVAAMAFFEGSQRVHFQVLDQMWNEELPNESPMPTVSPILGITTATTSAETVAVSRVIDGDTIELADGRTVRYIGIDTPETKDPRRGQQCFGLEAAEFNRQLVAGKLVRLEKDVSQTDRYGRLLRYVFLDDQFINLELVRQGYAVASSYPPDISRQTELAAAEAQARANQAGLWSACPVEPVNP